MVLLNKHFELILVFEHEQAGHVLYGDGLIGSLCGSSNLVADSIDELVDEELIGGMWNVMLRAENFVVRSLNEVLLEWHWNFDEHITELWNWDQLNLCVVFRDFIEGQEIEQVKAQYGKLFLAHWQDTIKLIIVSLDRGKVSLKCLDVSLLKWQESCILIHLSSKDAFSQLDWASWGKVLEESQIDSHRVDQLLALGDRSLSFGNRLKLLKGVSHFVNVGCHFEL